MLAGVNEELAIIEDRAEANIAVLGRIDDDMSILLVTSLRAKKLSVLRMLLNLGTQLLDLLFIIVEAVAKMLFHIAYLRLLREEIQQVFNLENIILSDDGQSLLDFYLLPFFFRIL